MKPQWWWIAPPLVLAAGVWALCAGSPIGNSTETKLSANTAETDSVESQSDCTNASSCEPDEVLKALAEVEAAMGPPLKPPAGWAPSPEPEPSGPKTLPILKSKDGVAAQFREAVRWFESMPRGAQDKKTLEASRNRLAKAQLQLIANECRQEFCRYSFAYGKSRSSRFRKESAQIRPYSWSFTIIAPNNQVEGHIFVSAPQKSR